MKFGKDNVDGGDWRQVKLEHHEEEFFSLKKEIGLDVCGCFVALPSIE